MSLTITILHCHADKRRIVYPTCFTHARGNVATAHFAHIAHSWFVSLPSLMSSAANPIAVSVRAAVDMFSAVGWAISACQGLRAW